MSKDVLYGIELYLPHNKSWHRLSNCYDFESAKCAVNEYELSDKYNYGKKLDYRIMKITITKEIVG
jgi:hypothetical protein